VTTYCRGVVILHRLVGLGLVVALLALAPAAHMSPPDQSWITGLYDNADFDDVVLLITGDLGAIEPSTVSSLRPVALSSVSLRRWTASCSACVRSHLIPVARHRSPNLPPRT